MGASQGIPEKRHSLEKGELRRQLAASYAPALEGWREAELQSPAGARAQPSAPSPGRGLLFAARKRPLFARELEGGDFDALSADGLGRLWAHQCELRMDFQHMYVDNRRFAFDFSFGAEESTDGVFERCVLPLLRRKTLRGGRAGVLLFGQTGSGKTFTLRGLLARTLEELLEQLKTL